MSSRLIPKLQLRVTLTALVWLLIGPSAMWSASACAPVITNSPACATKCPGANVTFSVTAGPVPLGYQWRKNGNPLAGATTSTYSITSVSSTDAGSYSVVVSNTAGTATSASATLTVNTATSASPLTNLVRSVGANALFSTSASGTGPFSYVWDKGGTVLAVQTNSSLTLTNLALSDSGVYQVTVSGACGSASSSATLTVDACFPAVDVMLVIDRSGSMSGQKYNDARQACSNFVQNLNFSTNADQAGLVSYNSAASLDQTLTNNLQALDQAIHSIPAASGNTSISLGLQTAQTELLSSRHNPQALPVLILLSDGLPTGSDTKSNALYVATQAKNAGTLIFTVGLGADVDPVLMAGIAASSSDYFFTTNSSQLSALFNAISTLICRPPTNIFLNGLSNLTLCAGSPANFSVTVSATFPSCAPYSYQWQKDGVCLSGQNNSSLVISNVCAADAGVYAVQVTSVCRCATNSATLTVNQSVVVASAPVSVTNCPGTSASFNVSATGTGL
ncbi:MAG: VWA domain-containing protein, partial [Verrucomicrobiota bacterium]